MIEIIIKNPIVTYVTKVQQKNYGNYITIFESKEPTHFSLHIGDKVTLSEQWLKSLDRCKIAYEKVSTPLIKEVSSQKNG
jgi:hypothetical protein